MVKVTKVEIDDRRRLMARVMSLQAEAQTNPDGETRALLAQARRALHDFDEAESPRPPAPGFWPKRRPRVRVWRAP
jgi:hypothetical protein